MICFTKNVLNSYFKIFPLTLCEHQWIWSCWRRFFFFFLLLCWFPMWYLTAFVSILETRSYCCRETKMICTKCACCCWCCLFIYLPPDKSVSVSNFCLSSLCLFGFLSHVQWLFHNQLVDLRSSFEDVIPVICVGFKFLFLCWNHLQMFASSI